MLGQQLDQDSSVKLIMTFRSRFMYLRSHLLPHKTSLNSIQALMGTLKTNGYGSTNHTTMRPTCVGLWNLTGVKQKATYTSQTAPLKRTHLFMKACYLHGLVRGLRTKKQVGNSLMATCQIELLARSGAVRLNLSSNSSTASQRTKEEKERMQMTQSLS